MDDLRVYFSFYHIEILLPCFQKGTLIENKHFPELGVWLESQVDKPQDHQKKKTTTKKPNTKNSS
jgi:hypothetical protein